MLIAGGFDGTNRLSSAEILRIGSAHTISVEPMPTARSNFAMCKMGKYFYAIGGYNTMVTKTVIRFDGKKWERICDMTVARSALSVVLLKAWPDPNELLCDISVDSKDVENSLCNSESSEDDETNSSKTVATSNDSD
uniref:Kelch repeat protein n=1 Tax=Elaeophora elaphi TaxID=1147741 RepID=A0A0R3RMP0_9BILA